MSPPPPPKPRQEILLRPGNPLTSPPQIGLMASKAYDTSPLTEFLNPHRRLYPADLIRGYTYRARSRLLNSSNYTYLAYLPSSPSPVGYIQFIRVGSDPGALAAKKRWSLIYRLFLWVGGWIWWIWMKIWQKVLGGDRSEDHVHAEQFLSWVIVQDKRFWSGPSVPERHNRYHIISLVVLEEYQRMGIGKRLVGEVLERAEKEGVMVGVESSILGEPLYRKLGFELLTRFLNEVGPVEEREKGGLFIWWPSKLKEVYGGRGPEGEGRKEK